MNYKKLMELTIKGEDTQCIPFVPRLDIWYNYNKNNNTLPDKYKNATLMEIVDDLGIGYHAIIPDFLDLVDGEDNIHSGFGILQSKTMPYTVELHNVKYDVVKKADGTKTVKYETPYGNITTKIIFSEDMKKEGVTQGVVLEHAIKSKDDFKAIGHIFKNMEVKNNYGYMKQLMDKVGDRGIFVAFTSSFASPMHFIQKELMNIEDFFFSQFDYPGEMDQLAEDIKGFYNSICEAGINSPADHVLIGANYDSTIVNPPFFEKYILPYLKDNAEKLHNKGKYLVSHTDGENKGLLKHYYNSNIDVADSICPAPMTSQSFTEIREKLGPDLTIWGGIPSVCMLEGSMSDNEFDNYLENFFTSIESGKHLIISIADTTPPQAKFDRILKINKKIKEFGAVK